MSEKHDITVNIPPSAPAEFMGAFRDVAGKIDSLDAAIVTVFLAVVIYAVVRKGQVDAGMYQLAMLTVGGLLFLRAMRYVGDSWLTMRETSPKIGDV